jgi:hypothetical protein
MAATRPQHETPMTKTEQSRCHVVDAVKIFPVAFRKKSRRFSFVHCNDSLMSLGKITGLPVVG